MDRAEARGILESMKLIDFRFAPKSKAIEALDLAIEALSEPKIMRCKGCNYFLGADEDTFCGLCSREDTQGDAESATTNLYDVQLAKDLLGISEEAEKLQLSGETSTCKLKKDHDFLIKPDSDECKEQKSKLDCISRADAIAYIDRILNSGLGKNKSLDYIRKYIYALPPVTPTERTGEWVSHELWDMPWFTCSECNYHGRSDFKFCPNCGAKMKGAEE